MAANRDVIQTALNWFYQNTTEEQRDQLSERNPMADPSSTHEGFKKTALHVIGEMTEEWGLVSARISVDSVRMLLRGLQAIEAHGEFERTTDYGRPYRLPISPVEAIWPAWENAYTS